MSRAEFLSATDTLIGSGEALLAEPAWEPFRNWLLESDRLLERVWGRMDRRARQRASGIGARRGRHPPLRCGGRQRKARRPAYDADVGRAPGLDPAFRRPTG
jgi:hypothetical protein